jgi:ribonuclease P protein component
VLTNEQRHIPRREFPAIMTRGVSRRLSPLGVRVVSRGDIHPSRFGFIVSTKVSKKAVVRNRIRRRLQAIIRVDRTSIIPGLDVVVIASPEAATSSYDVLHQVLTTLLTQVHVFRA